MAPMACVWKALLWFLLAVPGILAGTKQPSRSFLELPFGDFNLSQSLIQEPIQHGVPVCDAVRAGWGLRRASCEEAATRIPTDNLLLRFARRGHTIHEVQIPRRYSSCMLFVRQYQSYRGTIGIPVSRSLTLKFQLTELASLMCSFL